MFQGGYGFFVQAGGKYRRMTENKFLTASLTASGFASAIPITHIAMTKIMRNDLIEIMIC